MSLTHTFCVKHAIILENIITNKSTLSLMSFFNFIFPFFCLYFSFIIQMAFLCLEVDVDGDGAVVAAEDVVEDVGTA